jgi:methylthioxylose transferase
MMPLRSRRRELVALVVLAVLLIATAVWAQVLVRAGADLRLFSAPFFGEWRPRVRPGVLVAMAVGLVLVTVGPRVARTVRWSSLMVVVWVATVAWSAALSSATGLSGLTRTLRSRYDYAAVLPEVRTAGLGPFVRTYADRLADYPTHVKSHPPGMVVLLRVLEFVGLRGNGWAVATMIALAATVPCAIALVVRGLAGATVARPLLPFLICAPWTLMVATVADGVFAALAAWAAALLVLAVGAGSDRSAWIAGAGAGLVAGLGVYASYGLVPVVGALCLAILVPAGRVRLLVPVLAGFVTVALLWTVAGFDWLDGFEAARAAYRAGVASQRPYLYFVIANLVVFAVMLGPAVVAALCRRLDPSVVAIVAGSLAAVAIADLSGLSKGEVERIWVPLVPFVTIAATRIARGRDAAGWLAAQATTAIALQVVINWPW